MKIKPLNGCFMKKLVFILVALIGLGGLLNAQYPEWMNYNVSNSGLPNNSVNSIAIDENGTKWIGTQYGGLTKFEDTIWTSYNTSNSGMPANWVMSIAIEAYGIKWIGTMNGGLVRFDDINWTIYNNFNSGLPGVYVCDIAIDGSGMKWLVTLDGLVTFDGTNWMIYDPSNSGLPNVYILSVAIEENGVVWIGTGHYYNPNPTILGRLTKFDGNIWTTYDYLNSGLPNSNVGTIAIDSYGTKWIGTSNGLVKFDGTDWITYDTTNSGIPDDMVSAIAIDSAGVKWIGTFHDGIARFDGAEWIIYNTANSGLSNDDVNSITIDGNGTKWVGTDGGVSVFNENGITFLEEEITENNVKVFPNPVKDIITIEMPAGLNIYSIEIYNMQGNVVKSQKVANNQKTIDVGGLDSGVYIVRVQTDGGAVMKKMVKE
jgi:ligand-binding sensor domain-containing protein